MHMMCRFRPSSCLAFKMSCEMSTAVFALAQISGDVDQTAGMLDDEAKEKGYALMCVAEPQSDCRIKVIEEVCS